MNKKIAKKSSKVWNYYTLENKTAVCNLCNASITHKYVTNLRKHLLRKHVHVSSFPTSRKRRITKENSNVNSVQTSRKNKLFSYNSLNTANATPEMSASNSNLRCKKNRQRTSIIWKFFVLKDKMAECNLCKQKLSFRSLSTSDLKKHLQRIHPTVKLVKDNNVLTEERGEDLNINPVENSSLIDNSLTAPNTESEMPISCWAIYDLKNKYMKHRIRTSPIWNFFNLENKIAECKLCKKKLSSRSFSTSDLKKHLKRIHPTIEIPKVDENARRRKRMITEENLSNTPCHTIAVNACVTENSENIVIVEPHTTIACSTSNLNYKITKKGNKTSMVWNFFTLENKMAMCNLCRRIFSFLNSSAYPNLRRHLIQQHPNVQLSKDVNNSEVIGENLNNFIETPLISVDNSETTIGTELGTSISSLELDLNYGFRKHRKKTSVLWNFFTLENETAICKLCGKGISYRFWSVTNLKKHMLWKHPTIELSKDVSITEITEENFNDNSEETPYISVLLIDNSENTISAGSLSSVLCPESNIGHEYQGKIKETSLELPKNISVSDVTENNMNENSMSTSFIDVILADDSENTTNVEHDAALSFSGVKDNNTIIKNKIRTSKVWSFYTLENELAICKLCKMTYSYKSVSGLRKHLIRRHATEGLPDDINILYNDKSRCTAKNESNNSENSADTTTVPTSCVASALTHGKKKTGKRTSVVWNYFTYQDNKTAVCNFCKMAFSCKSSITDLKKHLIRKHDIRELPKDANISVNHESNINEKKLFNNIGHNPCISKSLTSTSKISITNEHRITQLHPSLDLVISSVNEEERRKFLKKTLSLSTKSILDNLVLDLFIYDFQPFTIVEDELFQNSMKVLSPSYRLPTKETFMNTLLLNRYERCYNKLKKGFSETKISSVILTLDSWTLENKKCFLAVICNFINENFEVESKLLECFSFSESGTVSNLAMKLERIAKEWGLEDKILLCVSDNAANTKLAVTEILKWNHFECFAHAISSIANDGLELHVYISSIIKNIKSVVQYFKMNADSMKILLDLQEQLGYVPKELLSDVPLAWKSTFYMLERFVELEAPICSALAVVDDVLPGLDSREWKIAAELVEVLQPLEEITEIMSGEAFVTASSVIIITKGMENAYKEMLDYSLLQETRELVETIALSIQCRLGDLECNDTLLISTFLDPRFKTVGFSNARTAEKAKTLVINLLKSETKLAEFDERQMDNNSYNGIPVRKMSSTVWNQFDRTVMECKSRRVTNSQVNIEVQRYLEEPLLRRTEDPLKWWQENSQNYPLLKMIFLKNFALLGTSVPCEQLFSKTDAIPCDWRSYLSLEKIEELLFLNANDLHERSTFFHV